MLVAHLNGERVVASRFGEKGLDYRCPNPNCRRPEMVLKPGRFVKAHFAHKSASGCEWARGETQEHMEAKQDFAAALAARGYKSEVEFVVATLPGDRRADVMLWNAEDRRIAIELQHTPIGLPEIERRAFSYAEANIAQIWIPFLRPGVLKSAVARDGGEAGDLFVAQFSPRPFELWAYGFAFNELWFYDSERKKLWCGRLDDHVLYMPGRDYPVEGGDTESTRGYPYPSKRWRDLTLWGPYDMESLQLRTRRRDRWTSGPYNWPACNFVRFQPI